MRPAAASLTSRRPFRAWRDRVRAHPAVGKAGAEVGGFADRTGRRDLGRVVGRLDVVRMAPLGDGDLRGGGVTAVAGWELLLGEAETPL